MKIIEKFYNSDLRAQFAERPHLEEDLFTIFCDEAISFCTMAPREIKNSIHDKMIMSGWAYEVKLPSSNMTINYLKNRVCLCVQLGNVARTHTDLLKIQYLFQTKMIDFGVYVVPISRVAKKMGSNHAQYERLCKEIKIFGTIINVPIWVLGLGD